MPKGLEEGLGLGQKIQRVGFVELWKGLGLISD